MVDDSYTARTVQPDPITKVGNWSQRWKKKMEWWR